jgi:hypothetical protein
MERQAHPGSRQAAAAARQVGMKAQPRQFQAATQVLLLVAAARAFTAEMAAGPKKKTFQRSKTGSPRMAFLMAVVVVVTAIKSHQRA